MSEREEIEAELASITPGEWFVEDDGECWNLYATGAGEGHPYKLAKCPKVGGPYANYWPTGADSDFIANAPARARRLVEVLEERDRLVVLLRDAVKAHDAIVVAYRTGSNRTPEKAIDRMTEIKQILAALEPPQ